jgi:hypothetical protein
MESSKQIVCLDPQCEKKHLIEVWGRGECLHTFGIQIPQIIQISVLHRSLLTLAKQVKAFFCHLNSNTINALIIKSSSLKLDFFYGSVECHVNRTFFFTN